MADDYRTDSGRGRKLHFFAETSLTRDDERRQDRYRNGSAEKLRRRPTGEQSPGKAQQTRYIRPEPIPHRVHPLPAPPEPTEHDYDHIEDRHRLILEILLPRTLRKFLKYPTLFVDITCELYHTINHFLDEKIKRMINNLGKALGIPDQGDILLDIVLIYPNSLETIEKESVADLRETVADIVFESLRKGMLSSD